jgi:CRISPR-associated protein Cas1
VVASRVGHGIERLIIIGCDGPSPWRHALAPTNAAFVMLDRDGSVLTTTGPVRSSDAKLRRAQALADGSGAALQIVRALIHQKLAGQEQVARDRLHDSAAADRIAQYREAVPAAATIQAIRVLESQGAAVYWFAWQNLTISFPRKDLPRVPEHWRNFKARQSPLSGSPRLAANLTNAMLNYLYALLESEARLAAAAVGLDPGMGFLHLILRRDSLAAASWNQSARKLTLFPDGSIGNH